MKTTQLANLPKKIQVETKIGSSGKYLAYLPEYDVFTEADSPSHLIFQVNDLIHTFFDVPKEYQSGVFFLPGMIIQKRLLKEKSTGKALHFKVNPLYSPSLLGV